MSQSRRELLGDSLTALCGGALALNLLLILSLLGLIAWQGFSFFWQKPLTQFELTDGRKVLGEVHARESRPIEVGAAEGSSGYRLQIKVGNRDLNGADFLWLDESEIAARSEPTDVVLLERLEWGNFYGRPARLLSGSTVLADGAEASWQALGPMLAAKEKVRDDIRDLEKGDIGAINTRIDRLRLERRRAELDLGLSETERASRFAAVAAATAEAEAEYQTLADNLFRQRETLMAETLEMAAADGTVQTIPVGAIVSAIQPNTLGTWGGIRLYLGRIWEFVSGEPREANTEGGIFPAIFGTVMMVFLMSIAVVPLGVLAALYLREYAKQGPVVRAVRIAVNNLAGVPSIVFGVFGLGFFVYLVGGSIDQLFYPEALPTPTFGTGGILWAALTLALLTVPVVIVATEEGLAAVPRVVREGSLALGATKWETTWKVVVPAAAPGILTGLILAMARAAGEVAPLMIVGMVKLAPALPVDGTFPFVHLERKFMHLGFHIFDVGFQSPNVDATKPLVFATALLLIGAVTLLNLVAIQLRNRLRQRYAGSAV